MPIIYANDNRGRWRSDFKEQLAASSGEGSRGAAIAKLLRPRPIDYCVLKPKHSGFFATPLGTLLEYLGTKRLILTGVSAHQCVLFTAIDGYLRDFKLAIPRDCVAAENSAMENLALAFFRKVLKASLCQSTRLEVSSD